MNYSVCWHGKIYRFKAYSRSGLPKFCGKTPTWPALSQFLDSRQGPESATSGSQQFKRLTGSVVFSGIRRVLVSGVTSSEQPSERPGPSAFVFANAATLWRVFSVLLSFLFSFSDSFRRFLTTRAKKGRTLCLNNSLDCPRSARKARRSRSHVGSMQVLVTSILIQCISISSV